LTAGAERESFAPNLHEHGKAILSMDSSFMTTKSTEGSDEAVNSRLHPALVAMVASELKIDPLTVEDLEMQLVDTQLSCLGGANNEFIYSGRLDNLCSAYQSLRALIDSSSSLNDAVNVKITYLFDHEEIGSASAQGAGSSLFMDTLQRIHGELSDSTNSREFLSFFPCCLLPCFHFIVLFSVLSS
jgi:aspartyl aminopeptidase